MTTTDTPRTDAVQFQKKPISLTIENEMLCALSRKLERELNESNRLKNLALSRMDDALEKAESLSTPDCHICHNKCQRPLCILSKQLAASKAEVERLNELVNESIFEKSNLSIALVNCQADLICLQESEAVWKTEADKADQRRLEAEAEVERLRDALDTLTLVVGLTPIAGNKEALQEAFNLARKALKPTNK